MTMLSVSAKLIACEDGSFGISAERERVERLVRSINSGEVSRLHIDEIIDDFLG